MHDPHPRTGGPTRGSPHRNIFDCDVCRRKAHTGPMQSSFFDALDGLARSAQIRIDRPEGSAHPRFPNVIYPLDYGFLDGTTAADGEGVDVFVGSRAGAGVTAVALTVDAGKRDVEVKVLLDCIPGEIDEVFAFLSGTLRLGTTIVHR